MCATSRRFQCPTCPTRRLDGDRWGSRRTESSPIQRISNEAGRGAKSGIEAARVPEPPRHGMQDGNLPSILDSGRSGRSAGRGGLAVLGAKVFFLVIGFAQQPLLRLVVGLQDFGALAQALVVANTVNNVVVSSATQGVSRVVAGASGREEAAFRATLKVHVVLAFAVAALVATAAPLYARFEHAQDVAPPLGVLAGVAFCYGVYAPLVGALNGTRQFGRQALLDVTFAILRTAGMLGVGWAFSDEASPACSELLWVGSRQRLQLSPSRPMRSGDSNGLHLLRRLLRREAIWPFSVP